MLYGPRTPLNRRWRLFHIGRSYGRGSRTRSATSTRTSSQHNTLISTWIIRPGRKTPRRPRIWTLLLRGSKLSLRLVFEFSGGDEARQPITIQPLERGELGRGHGVVKVLAAGPPVRE